MRFPFVFAALAALVFAACREQKSPERATAPLTSTTVHRATPVSPLDAGQVAAPEPLEKFAGFSRDESQFAYAVFSDGAGAFILQFVAGRHGEPQQRFVLDTPQARTQARAALDAGGFSAAQGALPEGVAVEARVADGKVVVTLRQGDAGTKVLYADDPFGGHGGPAAATQTRVSPSGKKVAVRVEQKPVTEFGGTTTWLLLDVEHPQ